MRAGIVLYTADAGKVGGLKPSNFMEDGATFFATVASQGHLH
jgi:hypothetical protein